MLVELPNKSTFFSPMQTDPINIREKLFQGIDKEYNVTNMGIVVEVLGELENFHMSREELELTRLGKHINELRRKASDKNLAGRAKSLIKKWRDLLSSNSDANSGPGPGGGNNNNNSSLATNGNAGSRLNNSHVATTSPRLSSNQTPGTRENNSRASHPVTNNVSKHSPKLPPSRTPVSSLSPKPPHIKTPVSNVSPRAPQREPRAHNDARAHNETRAPPPSQSARPVQSVRSVPPSPAKPTPPIVTVNNGSGSRDSPVVVSSGSSSPVSIVSVHSNSRPNSPSAAGSISIIKSREVSPQPHPQRSRTSSPANNLLNTGSKRFRSKDDSDPVPDAKHARLELHNGGGASVPSSPNHLHDRPKKLPRPRQRASLGVNSGYDLTKQMMHAKKKLRTTQELVSSLGIESRVQTSPAPVASVKDLVPNENKSELMDRFFSSQKGDDHGSEGEGGGAASEPPSRPSTALEDATSSEASSKVNSRVNTPGPPRESVEDILSQLPSIDTAAILAELAKEIDEEEPEVDGLIPAFKPLKEITSDLVDELNNGQLEHIGGIKDHNGEFKEWHEIASVQSRDGELLHILPYSVID